MIYMFLMSGCKLLTTTVSYGWFVTQFADYSPCPQSSNSMNHSVINDPMTLLHFDIMYVLYTLCQVHSKTCSEEQLGIFMVWSLAESKEDLS